MMKQCLLIIDQSGLKRMITSLHPIISYDMGILNNFISKAFQSMHSDSVGWLIVSLIIVILTRFVIIYSNNTQTVVAPESTIALPARGVDLYLAVFKPLQSMLQGDNFYYYTANYGPSFTLAAIPFYELADRLHFCSKTNEWSCSNVLYAWLIYFTVFGYVFCIWVITRGYSEIRHALFIFYIAFILGISGSLGLERGNIDIVLSLLFGISLLLFRYYHIYKTSNKSSIALIASCVIVAFLSASKILFLPFMFVFMLCNTKRLASVFVSIGTFIALSYLPNMIGAPSTVLDQFRIALVFEKEIPFVSHVNIIYNHSLLGISSLFTSCFEKQQCASLSDVRTMRFISLLLGYITLVLPIQATIGINKFIRSVLKTLIQWKITFVLIVIGVAIVNIVPKFSFDYRLYLSLPIVFVLYLESRSNAYARACLVFAMVALILEGVWAFQYIVPSGSTLIEARGWHLWVLVHYHFLIRSAVSLIEKRRMYVSKQ